jgi:hypothetical protein
MCTSWITTVYFYNVYQNNTVVWQLAVTPRTWKRIWHDYSLRPIWSPRPVNTCRVHANLNSRLPYESAVSNFKGRITSYTWSMYTVSNIVDTVSNVRCVIGLPKGRLVKWERLSTICQTTNCQTTTNQPKYQKTTEGSWMRVPERMRESDIDIWESSL